MYLVVLGENVKGQNNPVCSVSAATFALYKNAKESAPNKKKLILRCHPLCTVNF